jgi:hypothetical protein
MSRTYHIRINKEYAASVIEELCKNDAITLIPKEEAYDVPEWQMKEVQRRIADSNNNLKSMIDEEVFMSMLTEE